MFFIAGIFGAKLIKSSTTALTNTVTLNDQWKLNKKTISLGRYSVFLQAIPDEI
jgi:hypothetical protein